MTAEVAGVERRPSLATLMRTTPLATAILVMICKRTREGDNGVNETPSAGSESVVYEASPCPD